MLLGLGARDGAAFGADEPAGEFLRAFSRTRETGFERLLPEDEDDFAAKLVRGRVEAGAAGRFDLEPLSPFF